MSSRQRVRRETGLPPWYWPGIARDEAEKKLTGLPDGSFLVRDCSVPGDFTLIVRSQEACRCVRVYHLHGHYGLSETDTPFASLADLVQFYRTHSLAYFNKRLDVCLKGGVTMTNEVEEEVSQYGVFKELYDLSQEQLKAQTRLSILQKRHAELENNVATCRMMIPALEVVRQMYFDQIKLQTSVDSSVVDDKELRPKSSIHQVFGTLHGLPGVSDFDENGVQSGDSEETEKQCERSLSQEEEKSLAINTRLLAKRHSGLATKLQNMQTHLDTNTADLQDLLHELKSVEVCLLYMERRRKELTRQMVLMGIDSEYLTQVLETQVATAEFDQSRWLVNCDREEAVAQLSGLPHGAFLVRRKDRRHFPYVLSILVASTSEGPATVQHCYIVRPQGRGFGFNAALAVFQSVDQLILRHRYVSLKHYFRDIDAPLAFPVGCQEMLNRRSASMENLLDIGVFDGNYANGADESAAGRSGSEGTVAEDKVLEKSLRKSQTLGNDEISKDASMLGNTDGANSLQPEEWDTHLAAGSEDVIFTFSDFSESFGTGDVSQRNQGTSASVIKTTETLGPNGDENEVIYMNIDDLFNCTCQPPELVTVPATENTKGLNENKSVEEIMTSDDDDSSNGVYENVADLSRGSKTATNACKVSNTSYSESLTDTVTGAVRTDDNTLSEIRAKSEAAKSPVNVSSPALTQSTVSCTADTDSPSITNTDAVHTPELDTELSVDDSQGVSTATDINNCVAHLPLCDEESISTTIKDSEQTEPSSSTFCLSTVIEGKNKYSEHKTQMQIEQTSNVQNLGTEENHKGTLTPLLVQSPVLLTVPVAPQTRELNIGDNEGKDDGGLAKETQSDIDTASLPTDVEEEKSDTGSDENDAKPHVLQLITFFEKVKNPTVGTKESDSYVRVTLTGDMCPKARTLDVKSVSALQEKGKVAEQAKRKARTLDFELTGKGRSPCVAVRDSGQMNPIGHATVGTMNSTWDCIQKVGNANHAEKYPDPQQESKLQIEGSVNPVVEDSTEHVTKGSVNPVIDGSTEHVTKGSVKLVLKSVLKPVAKGSIKPVEERSIKPVEECSVEQLAQLCLQPVPGTSIKPVSAGSVTPVSVGSVTPVSAGSVTPVSAGSVKPIEEGSLAPIAGGSMKLVAEDSVKPVAGDNVKPVAGGSMKPVAEGHVKPVAEPLPEGSMKPGEEYKLILSCDTDYNLHSSTVQDSMKPAISEDSIHPLADGSILTEGVSENVNYNTLPAKTAAVFDKDITKTPLSRTRDDLCTDISHVRNLAESDESFVASLISRVKEKLAKNSSVNTTKVSDNDTQERNNDRLSERNFEAHVAGATCASKVLPLNQSLLHKSNEPEKNSKEGPTTRKESPDTTTKEVENNADKSEKRQKRNTNTASLNTSTKEIKASVDDANTTTWNASVKENKDNIPSKTENRQQHSTKSAVGADADLNTAGLVTYRENESLHTGVRSLSCSDADFVPDILVSTTVMKSLQVTDNTRVATMAPIFLKHREDDSDYVDV